MHSLINDIKSHLGNYLEEINSLYHEISDSNETLITKMSNDIFSSKSKRIRPIISLLSCSLFGDINKPAIYLAAASELIHTATLLHDDVIDSGNIRRGKATLHKIFGSNNSILMGDLLFSKAFEYMVKTDSLEALSCLAKTSSIIASGEISQHKFHSLKVLLNEDNYYKIIKAKTAELFKAICKVNAIIMNQPKHVISNMENFGLEIGIIYQLVDDFLDYFGSEDKLGKDLGKDFFESKITMPFILAFKKSSDIDQAILTKLITEPHKIGRDFNSILSIFKKYKITDCYKELLGEKLQTALSYLNKIDSLNKINKNYLEQISINLLNREY